MKNRYNVPFKSKDEKGDDRYKGQIAVGNIGENTAHLANGQEVIVRDANGNLIAGTIEFGSNGMPR